MLLMRLLIMVLVVVVVGGPGIFDGQAFGGSAVAFGRACCNNILVHWAAAQSPSGAPVAMTFWCDMFAREVS